jgi:hypothetical protein
MVSPHSPAKAFKAARAFRRGPEVRYTGAPIRKPRTAAIVALE